MSHHQEIVNEIVKVVGEDPATSFDQAREGLETLFHRYEGDEEAKQIINGTFARLSKIYEAHGIGVNVAIATKVALEKALNEHAELEQRHAGLVDDLVSMNDGNPLIDEVMHEIRLMRDEELMESGAWYSYCVGCDILDAGVPVAHDVGALFHDMLTGGYELPEERLHELAEFIESFVRSVQDEEATDAA